MDVRAAWDRCVFGAIGAAAGLLVGTVIAVVLFWEHPREPFHRGLILFSGIYFFVAGFALKARVADLLAGAADAGVQQAEREAGDILSTWKPVPTIPSDTLTGLFATGYVLGALAVVFLA